MPQTEWLKQEKLIFWHFTVYFYSSGVCKSKIKVLASLISSQTTLLELKMATFSTGPSMAFHCECASLVSVCPHLLLLERHQSEWIRVYPKVPLFNLITYLKALSSF